MRYRMAAAVVACFAWAAVPSLPARAGTQDVGDHSASETAMLMLGGRSNGLTLIELADDGLTTRAVQGVWDSAARSYRFAVNGEDLLVTDGMVQTSTAWTTSHSVLSRLVVRKGDAYWDGKKVDLGRVTVERVFEAIPWKGGVMATARTYRRKSFFERWPFKGAFIEAEEIEPFCLVYFDPTTLKGEARYLFGKHTEPFFVLPRPLGPSR